MSFMATSSELQVGLAVRPTLMGAAWNLTDRAPGWSCAVDCGCKRSSVAGPREEVLVCAQNDEWGGGIRVVCRCNTKMSCISKNCFWQGDGGMGVWSLKVGMAARSVGVNLCKDT